MNCEYSETGLPGCLQHDLDAFKEGVKVGSTARIWRCAAKRCFPNP